MSDDEGIRPLDWTEIAARAHEEGHRAGYRQGMEEAAKWHDAQAADWDGIRVISQSTKKSVPTQTQVLHEQAAAAIRAMMEGKG
jgi:hypothetical protein